MDLSDPVLMAKIEKVRAELGEALDPIMHETNRERDTDFKPHVTLVYKLTPEVKEGIAAVVDGAEGGTLEEKMNAFLKEKGWLPHTFRFDEAEFYGEGERLAF